jgi:hypothetical protein
MNLDATGGRDACFVFFFLTTEMLAVDLAPNVYAELIQTELR